MARVTEASTACVCLVADVPEVHRLVVVLDQPSLLGLQINDAFLRISRILKIIGNTFCMVFGGVFALQYRICGRHGPILLMGSWLDATSSRTTVALFRSLAD
jgi:hypothetical protein